MSAGESGMMDELDFFATRRTSLRVATFLANLYRRNARGMPNISSAAPWPRIAVGCWRARPDHCEDRRAADVGLIVSVPIAEVDDIKLLRRPSTPRVYNANTRSLRPAHHRPPVRMPLSREAMTTMPWLRFRTRMRSADRENPDVNSIIVFPSLFVLLSWRSRLLPHRRPEDRLTISPPLPIGGWRSFRMPACTNFR